MKKIILLIILIIIVIVAFYIFNNYIYDQKQGFAAPDFKTAEYILDGARIRLSETTKYFGNELKTDLDGDGDEDMAFIITHEPGGSGTFYYVVAALATERGYVGSEAFLLGDRIAPLTLEKGTGKILIVNYADRAPDEPFTTAPSVGKSVWLLLDSATRQFGTVEKNFEGEADPSKMTLDMKKWIWTTDSKFSLSFGKEDNFSATTDCNSVGGSYTTTNGSIAFSEIFSTTMFCENSKESGFIKMLGEVKSYYFTSRGELIPDLPSGKREVFK